MTTTDRREFARRVEVIVRSVPRGRHGVRKFENPLEYGQSVSQLKAIFCTYAPYLFAGVVSEPIWNQILRFHLVSVYISTRQLATDAVELDRIQRILRDFATNCRSLRLGLKLGNLECADDTWNLIREKMLEDTAIEIIILENTFGNTTHHNYEILGR